MTLKEYADALVKFSELSYKLKTCVMVDRCDHHDGKIQLHTGILELAKAVGCKVLEEYFDDLTYKYKYSFVYKKVTFLQLEEEKLEYTHD